jgi:hypothetical protein
MLRRLMLHPSFRTVWTPKPSSNHADKLAAQVVTPSFPW